MITYFGRLGSKCVKLETDERLCIFHDFYRVGEAESRLLGVEPNINNWQREQNVNNDFSATFPYDMEQLYYTKGTVLLTEINR